MGLINNIKNWVIGKKNTPLKEPTNECEYDNTAFKEFDECNLEGVYGSGKKMFLRCSGDKLLQMYDDITSGEHDNYVVCVDKAIKDEAYSRDMFRQSYVSGILKFPRKGYMSKYYIFSEIICSRIAELLGLRSAYVAPLNNTIENSPECYFSVDFLKEDEEMHLISEFSSVKMLGAEHGIKRWISLLKNILDSEIPSNNPNKTQIINNCIEEFINLFVIKGLILGDRDFRIYNVGIVCNKDKTSYHIAPAFDYELCLLLQGAVWEDIDSASPIDGVRSTIKFLLKNYPHVLNDIVDRLEQEGVDKEINDIVDSFVPPSYYWQFKNAIKGNKIYFTCEYSHILNKQKEKQLSKEM